jgi:hypothetical protein
VSAVDPWLEPPWSHVATPFDGSDDPGRQLFLRRLSRLLTLQVRAAGLLDPNDARLIDQAIYSTYCDLHELGASGDARALLRHYREMRRSGQSS